MICKYFPPPPSNTPLSTMLRLYSLWVPIETSTKILLKKYLPMIKFYYQHVYLGWTFPGNTLVRIEVGPLLEHFGFGSHIVPFFQLRLRLRLRRRRQRTHPDSLPFRRPVLFWTSSLARHTVAYERIHDGWWPGGGVCRIDCTFTAVSHACRRRVALPITTERLVSFTTRIIERDRNNNLQKKKKEHLIIITSCERKTEQTNKMNSIGARTNTSLCTEDTRAQRLPKTTGAAHTPRAQTRTRRNCNWPASRLQLGSDDGDGD